MDYEFDIVFDLDLAHNAISSKDRSSLFDGKIITKPAEEVGSQIITWLNRSVVSPSPVVGLPAIVKTDAGHPSNSQPEPEPQPHTPPLFTNNGHNLGEKETEAMLFAIQHATSVERLFSIEQSMTKGLKGKKITTEQAEKVKQAIQERSTQLAQTKAA